MTAKLDDYYCKTCGKKIRYRQCIEHHKLDHEVWHIDSETGEMDYRYPKTTKLPKLKLSTESGGAIEEHAKAFVEPENETLFIYYKGGKVERFWDRFGDHESIFRALLAGGQFEGSPVEFVDASAHYMLAAAGYEPTPCIIPKTQRQAYEETARLIKEGVLKVYYDQDGRMRLKPNPEKIEEEANARDTLAQSGVSAGGDQHQPEGLPTQEGEQKLGQPQ